MTLLEQISREFRRVNNWKYLLVIWITHKVHNSDSTDKKSDQDIIIPWI